MTQSPVVVRQFFDLRDGAVIKTPVSVSLPWRQHNVMRPPPPKLDTFAVWNTGATNTAFDNKLVADLGLAPQRPATISTSHGPRSAHFHLANVYLFNLLFPVAIVDVEIRQQKNPPPSRFARVLIGMDIIMKGDFAVSYQDYKLELFFRVPSEGLTSLIQT